MTDHNSTTTLSQTVSDVRDEAGALGSKAVEKLAAAADTRKGAIAEPIRQVSDAIDEVATKLDGNNGSIPPWATEALHSAASGISEFAQRVETSDSRQLLADVQNFAREKPGMFLAGCAALGFAAARVLRAGATDASDTPSSQDEWHEGDTGSFGYNATAPNTTPEYLSTPTAGLMTDEADIGLSGASFRGGQVT